MNTVKLYRYFVIACVCTAFGAVANLLLILLVAFIFAGAEGNTWIRWYFEAGNGLLFFIMSIIIGSFVFPYAKKLKLGHA